MAQVDYHLVEPKHTIYEDHNQDFQGEDVLAPRVYKPRRLVWLLATICVISVSINIVQQLHLKRSALTNAIRHEFAPVGTKLVKVTHDNRTLDDDFWLDERHNIFRGMVALDNDYVREHGLLQAQRYPWDTSKSVYFIHGFHSMHCIQVLRDIIIDARDKRNLSWSVEHTTHCLHSLRADVECYADDQPHYTGRFNGQEHAHRTLPGLGETRVCRDWDHLRSFALQNTACWNQNLVVGGRPLSDSYKDCPDGSRPWETLGYA